MNETDKHIMIDLETLGTRSNAVILSIGAVQFDLKGNVEVILHRGVSIDSCLEAGLQVDADTIKWWMQQDKANIDRLMSLPNYPLELVLVELRERIKGLDIERWNTMGNISYYVWSHGNNFDPVILENAYRAVGQKVWWKYNCVRDTRTLFDVVGYKYTAKGGHDALEDAVNQAHGVVNAYQQLMRGREQNGMH